MPDTGQDVTALTAGSPKSSPISKPAGLRRACCPYRTELGVVDVLVNNAGIIRRANLLEFAEADWDEVMAVNLKAVFL